MTATQVRAGQARRVRWWDLRARWHRLHDNLAHPASDARTLVTTGRPVRFRFAQSLVFNVILGFTGATIMAGAYYAFLQVHWYVWIGPVHFEIMNLKPWWDGTGAFAASGGMGFILSGNWWLYRHAIRDLGEPAVAVMFTKTVTAKAKYKPVSTLRLVTAPVVLLLVLFFMAIGGTWLLDFGGPDVWAHAATAFHHRGFTLDGDFAWLGKISAGVLALGFATGFVLHRFWAPVGATLQGDVLSRSVAKARSGSRFRLSLTRIPLWVTYPVSPPVVRERWSQMYRDYKPGQDSAEVRGARRAALILRRLVLTVILLLAVVLFGLGALAKFWIAHGHTVPYLAP